MKISLNDCFVLRFGRSDKGIIAYIQAFPERFELRSQFVAVGLWLDSRLSRGLLDFLPMLVESRQKKDITPTKPPIACEHVGGNRGVGMSDVWDVVHIVNRGGDIEGLLISHKTLGRLRRGGEECVAKPQQNVFKRHMEVEMPRRLLMCVLDVEQGVALCWSRVAFQDRHLIHIQQLIAIAPDLNDHKVSDPTSDPRKRFG